ncbi:MAG: hypothetical protein AAGD25_27110 [Cyanobacteria bacterium P01_F01_bin.150]
MNAPTTKRACHLDARMVAGGIHQIEQHHTLTDFDSVFVENVGNLVCPAEFEVEDYQNGPNAASNLKIRVNPTGIYPKIKT